MVYYFYGEDTYAARQAIGELAREQGAAVRWADRSDFLEVSAAEVVARAGAGLFGRQLLVVRDAGALAPGVQQELMAALVAAGDDCTCVLWDRSGGREVEVARASGVQRRQFQPLKAAELCAWVCSEATRRGGAIEPSAAREMVERAGPDRWRIASELDKLLLVTQHVRTAHVRARVDATGAVGIFPVLEALARGDTQRAVRGVVERLTAGDSEFYLLSMLAYQFRTLYRIRCGIAAGRRAADIAREHKLAAYAVQKNYPYARRFSVRALREALTRVLAADFAIRRGRVEARTGLVMLVLGLADRSRA